MKTVIVPAMHGTPPTDFPAHEMAEYMGLYARRHTAGAPASDALEHRYAELEARLRAWPRTAQNDPYYFGSQDLAEHLSRVAGCEVIIGFNEFCAPGLDEALNQACMRVSEGEAREVVVLTPMLTQGGEHSEEDIPAAVRRARDRYLGIPVLYVWPIPVKEVAEFLATQMGRFVGEKG